MEIRVRNDELWTIREAMRELNRMVAQLESGELEKLVLTQRNRMRAVVLSAERFSEMQEKLDDRLAALEQPLAA
jgi:prevent-host-death family protein